MPRALCFRIEPNEDEVEGVSFEFAADRCRFSLTDARGTHRIDVGLGRRIEGWTSMTGNKLHHQYQPDYLRVIGEGGWLDQRTFEMVWSYVETAFRDRVTCKFDGDRIRLERSVNVNSGATERPPLHGQLA